MKKFLILAMCVFLCFALTSCESESESEIESAYLSGYDDGYSLASDIMLEYGRNRYAAGYDEAYNDLKWIADDNAVHYAREHSKWHPEEAMCVIDAYESGNYYYGKDPITEKDYKEAIKSLYYYSSYFYYEMYENEMECDYDN